MFAHIVHDSPREHRRLFLAGVVYLTAAAVLIALSIAVYEKVFTPVTMVTVHADRAGLQLGRFGDVRLHGVLVGQVRSIEQDGHQAVIRLGLDPAAARAIPANVSVAILPTTLFGQKYVSFVDPRFPSSRPLHDGEVIPSTRVRTSTELESVLARLFPLLRAVRPADLNTTLHALATALTGNGDRIGDTMQQLDAYLRVTNQHVPTLRRDIAGLARVANTYALAAPDLVRVLRNATTTARTVAGHERQLAGFFSNLTTLSGTATDVLRTNGPGLGAGGRLSTPRTRLLDTYSPEFPCLLEGLDRYTGRLNQIFAHSRVSQKMILDGTQRPAYTQADRPVYGEVGHGPWCLGLPQAPYQVPYPPAPLKDGTHADDGTAGRGR
ncbi:MAG: MCE family protein [Marmoricola sp.]